MRYDKLNKRTQKLINDLNEIQSKKDASENELVKVKSILQSTMHEVRRFSGELSSYSEDLNKHASGVEQNEKIKALTDNIFYTSGLLTARLAFTDIELNPRSIQQQTPLRIGIYKKFEKARYVLFKQSKFKDLSIEFTGTSFYEINAIQAFELVPFLILDNAIKYSPKNQSITVKFEEDTNKSLIVNISNVGPLLIENESHLLFERGKRGVHANQSTIGGEGLGLYFAKSLCDICGVEMNISSDKKSKYKIDNIPYADFSISMRFTR